MLKRILSGLLEWDEQKNVCVWQGKYDSDDAVGEAGMRHNGDDAMGQKVVSRSQDDSM